MNNALGTKRLKIERRDKGVRYDIVDEVRPHRAWKSQIVDLNGRRSKRQNFGPRADRVALQIDEDVHFVASDTLGRCTPGERSDVDKGIESILDPPSHLTVVTCAEGIATNLEAGSVVTLE